MGCSISNGNKAGDLETIRDIFGISWGNRPEINRIFTKKTEG